MDFLKNPIILLTNPFIFPLLIFLLFVLAINLPFIIFFYTHGFFSLFNPNIKQSDVINSHKFNLKHLGFLFLPTRLAVKSIQTMQINFSLRVALFVLIFSLFVIWQIFKQSYLLLNLFGWDWLAWLGFILALIVLFFVGSMGISDMVSGLENKTSLEMLNERLKQKQENEKTEE